MLTGLIAHDKDFQNCIRDFIPQKNDFYTLSGETPFSKYPVLVEYNITKKWNSGIVGTAFDYIARIIIANTVGADLRKMSKEFLGYNILAFTKRDKDKKAHSAISKKIKEIEKCVNRKRGLEPACFYDLIENAYFLARFESVCRTGLPPVDGYISLLSKDVEYNVLEWNIQRMIDVFFERFLGIISQNSVVYFNPNFNAVSLLCGGADADLFFDGTLLDFKTSKLLGYHWKEVAQLYCYFLLDCLAKISNLRYDLLQQKIHRLMFYRARYGVCECIDTDSFNPAQIETVLCNLVDYFFDEERVIPFRLFLFAPDFLDRGISKKDIHEWVLKCWGTNT